MSETRSLLWRWAWITFSLHALFSIVASSTKNFLWGSSSLPHQASRLLQNADIAVLWIIDPLLQRFTVPPSWVGGRYAWAAAINESAAHGILE